MREYFVELFVDKTAFVRFLRGMGGAFALFVVQQPEWSQHIPKGWGYALVFLSLFLKSGDVNPTTGEVKEKLDKLEAVQPKPGLPMAPPAVVEAAADKKI